MIALPEEVEARVEAQLAEEEGIVMPEVMSRWEARAVQRGQEQGWAEGQQALIFTLLEQQCGTLPEDIAAQVRELPSEQLTDLGMALLRFSQLGDLTAWLDANAPVAR